MSKNEPTEPFSSQCLRAMHKYSSALSDTFAKDFMPHLEDRKTQEHVLRKLDSLVKERAEIEKLHNAKHPGQEPLERYATDDEWMEDDDDDDDDGHEDRHRGGTYDDGREVPTEDEVARGMRAQRKQLEQLQTSLANLSSTLGGY